MMTIRTGDHDHAWNTVLKVIIYEVGEYYVLFLTTVPDCCTDCLALDLSTFHHLRITSSLFNGIPQDRFTTTIPHILDRP